MTEEDQRLIGLLNKWQDENDLRPSEVAASLLRMVGYFTPTYARDALQPLISDGIAALTKSTS